MNKDCSNEGRLADLVQKFVALNGKNPTETRHMRRLYRSIRNLCLVRVYTQPSIRKLIPEDEMSGFILELDSNLKAILFKYDPLKLDFDVYLKKAAEFKALNYLTAKMKRDRLETVALRTHMNETYEDKWEIDWENLLQDDELFGIGNQKAIHTLRYMCSERPNFQKRLFIFVCTVLLSIPSTMLEKLCSSFGFDFTQTLVVNECIHEELEDTGKIHDRDMYVSKRNRNWSWLMYYQNQFVAEGNNAPDEYEKQLIKEKIDLYKERMSTANNRLAGKRSKVGYPVISKILGIPEGTISSSVFTVKNLLKAILMDENEFNENETALGPKAPNGLLSMIEESKEHEIISLALFKPFETFNIEHDGGYGMNCDLEGLEMACAMD